jgi:hypothetical protein
LPADAVFIFGHKAPCEAAEKIMLKRVMSLHRKTFLVVQSIDEESTTAGDWRQASVPTIRRLSKRVKTKQNLGLYPNAHFEFTHNEKDRFNQGQLGILLAVPTKEYLQEQRPTELWKAPSGTKVFPAPEDCNSSFLSGKGWTLAQVPFSISRPETVFRGIQARRAQCGLKPRVSSTIHGCMGSTLSLVVTALVAQPNNRLAGTTIVLDFSLWEAAQVVVLLSRTRRARDIYFVGNRDAAMDHLLSVLKKTHRFLPCINKLLSDLCNELHATPIYYQSTAFRPCDALIGSVPAVHCTMLVGRTLDTARERGR